MTTDERAVALAQVTGVQCRNEGGIPTHAEGVGRAGTTDLIFKPLMDEQPHAKNNHQDPSKTFSPDALGHLVGLDPSNRNHHQSAQGQCQAHAGSPGVSGLNPNPIAGRKDSAFLMELVGHPEVYFGPEQDNEA